MLNKNSKLPPSVLHNVAAMRGELPMQINADLKSPFNERSEV